MRALPTSACSVVVLLSWLTLPHRSLGERPHSILSKAARGQRADTLSAVFNASYISTEPSSLLHVKKPHGRHKRLHSASLLSAGINDPASQQKDTVPTVAPNASTTDLDLVPLEPGAPSLGDLLGATEMSTLFVLVLVLLIMTLMSPGMLPVQKALNRYFGSVPSGAERPKGNIYRLLAGVGPDEIGLKAWRRLRMKAVMIALMQVYIPVQMCATLSATYGRPVGMLSYRPPPLVPVSAFHVSCFIFWVCGELLRITSLLSLANLVCTNTTAELAEESANDCHLLQRRMPSPGENSECEKVIPWLRWKHRNGSPLDDDRKIAYMKLVQRLVCFSSSWIPEQGWVHALELPDVVPSPGSTWPQDAPAPDVEKLPGHQYPGKEHEVSITHVASVIASFYLAGRATEQPDVPPSEEAHVRLAAAHTLLHLMEAKGPKDPERIATTALVRRCLEEIPVEAERAHRSGDGDRETALETLLDVLEDGLHQLTDGAEGTESDELGPTMTLANPSMPNPSRREPFDELGGSKRESFWVIVSMLIKIVSALVLQIAAFYKLCTLTGSVIDMIALIMALLFVNDMDDKIMSANPDFRSLYRQNVFMQITDKTEDGPDHLKVCPQLTSLAKAVDKVGVPIARLIMWVGCCIMFTARWRNKITGDDLPGVLKLT